MKQYEIGVNSDFNRTGYGVFYRIDKNRIAWVGDVYETWEEAHKEMLSCQKYAKDTFANNYTFSLEQQRKKEESKRDHADERMTHYSNTGNEKLMYHFESVKAECEGAIKALDLAIRLFKMGMNS